MVKKIVATLCLTLSIASCGAQEVDNDISPPYVIVNPDNTRTLTRYNMCNYSQPDRNRYICTSVDFAHSPNKDRSYLMIDAATCLEYMVVYSAENGAPVVPLYSLNVDCTKNVFPFDRDFWSMHSVPVIR